MAHQELIILPGWAEGKRQLARFLELLRDSGYLPRLMAKPEAHSEKIPVLAHSGGCYQKWSSTATREVILLAPPFLVDGMWTNQELLRRARLRTKQLNERARQQRAYAFRLRSRLRMLLSIRSTIRHRQAVRSIGLIDELSAWLASDPQRHLTVLLYQDDPWTDAKAAEAFRLLPNTKVVVAKGDHDDLTRRPEKAARLITRHTSLNLIK